MSPKVTIRRAVPTDAMAISRIIKKALRESNANDYPASVIDRLLKNFDPVDVARFLNERTVFVAQIDQRVVGTASLDRDLVRTVFIEPDMQRQGIGRRLMASVQGAAQRAAVPLLCVPSSITAVPFYEKLGFQHVREEHHDGDTTIIMQRDLTALSPMA